MEPPVSLDEYFRINEERGQRKRMLTPEQVADIRRRFRAGESLMSIARSMNPVPNHATLKHALLGTGGYRHM